MRATRINLSTQHDKISKTIISESDWAFGGLERLRFTRYTHVNCLHYWWRSFQSVNARLNRLNASKVYERMSWATRCRLILIYREKNVFINLFCFCFLTSPFACLEHYPINGINCIMIYCLLYTK